VYYRVLGEVNERNRLITAVTKSTAEILWRSQL
jgi:hypothetical protein